VIDQLCDPSARAVFFPVRHHSPACARHVRALARAMKPAAVLIEGPSDFNERVAELHLPHTLPIAIYSYVRLEDGSRRGGYHPLCEYSPEWVALRTARELKAVTRFIDLPYADIANIDATANRYADRGLAQSKFVARLCARAGVETFDELWDAHFEADRDLPLEEFLRRAHQFCLHSRLMDAEVSESDRLRESFMAEQVRAALKEFKGRVLVVTGGYHSSALFARLNGIDFHGTRDTPREASAPNDGERGIALTPYSYERLDSLRGYNAGMPNPGFYHQAWLDSEKGRTDTRAWRRCCAAPGNRSRARTSSRPKARRRAWRRCAAERSCGAPTSWTASPARSLKRNARTTCGTRCWTRCMKCFAAVSAANSRRAPRFRRSSKTSRSNSRSTNSFRNKYRATSTSTWRKSATASARACCTAFACWESRAFRAPMAPTSRSAATS
jgi:hypothetical protein